MTKPEDMPKCADCRFLVGSQEGVVHAGVLYDGNAECREGPPVINSMTNRAEYPKRGWSSSGCFKFEPKEETND